MSHLPKTAMLMALSVGWQLPPLRCHGKGVVPSWVSLSSRGRQQPLTSFAPILRRLVAGWKGLKNAATPVVASLLLEAVYLCIQGFIVGSLCLACSITAAAACCFFGQTDVLNAAFT